MDTSGKSGDRSAAASDLREADLREAGLREAGLREAGRGYLASWLQGVGAGALGVLIGFILGLAAAPSSMSAVSVLERSVANRAAPAKANDSVIPEGVPPSHPKLPDVLASPAPTAAAAGTSSWGSAVTGADLSPSMGGMETCWSAPDAVTC